MTQRELIGRLASWGSAGARFTFTVGCDLDADDAWRRIVDVASHGRVVPLTTGRGPAPDDVTVGSRLVARTAVGPVGFDDVMLVREASPGRRLVLEKVGCVIGGRVDVRFRPMSAGSCEIDWRQSITLPFLGPLGVVPARVAAPLVARGYRLVLERLLA